jgi:hypothetical protein
MFNVKMIRPIVHFGYNHAFLGFHDARAVDKS